ncbi:hypothetical protein Pelo_234 [Pelomyxa schiedti]|nr:hypothetical protein Pelo_234 [Pelomyxa schiedti]
MKMHAAKVPVEKHSPRNDFFTLWHCCMWNFQLRYSNSEQLPCPANICELWLPCLGSLAGVFACPMLPGASCVCSDILAHCAYAVCRLGVIFARSASCVCSDILAHCAYAVCRLGVIFARSSPPDYINVGSYVLACFPNLAGYAYIMR